MKHEEPYSLAPHESAFYTKDGLSDGRKLQFIHDLPAANKKWRTFTKEQRRFVLDGMELGINPAWIIGLIEEAEEL